MQRVGVWCSLGVVGVLCLAGTAKADDSIKEGRWEFTTEVQMEGMPQMPELPPGVKLPPGMSMSAKGNTMRTTMNKCVTKQDMVPSDEGKKNCKVTKMDRRGNTVSWRVECQEGGTRTTGDGTATYTGNTMQSKMVMTTQSGGHSSRQEMKTTGRYLGACVK